MATQPGVRQTAITKKPVTAVRRLKQDFMMIVKDPVPYVDAAPLPSNILEWHYVIRGPEGSPYHRGIYHGKLRFPPDYPFKPPSIYMITPNGRFKPNTRLCLSISDFHPDTWNPTWNLSTILTGLLSFMLENNSTYGSITTTKREKQVLALKSWDYNLNDKLFCELFPEIADEIKDEQDKRKAETTKANNGSPLNNATKQNDNSMSFLSNSTNNNNNENSNNTTTTTTNTPNNDATEQQQPLLKMTNDHRSNSSKSFLWSVLYNLIAVFVLVLFFYIVRFILRDTSMFQQ